MTIHSFPQTSSHVRVSYSTPMLHLSPHSSFIFYMPILMYLYTFLSQSQSALSLNSNIHHSNYWALGITNKFHAHEVKMFQFVPIVSYFQLLITIIKHIFLYWMQKLYHWTILRFFYVCFIARMFKEHKIESI